MRHAIIDDGRVVDVVLVGAGFEPPSDRLAVPSDTANIGDSYDGDLFASPAATAPSRADLTAYAAAARYRIETAGISVGQLQVATDDRGKALLSSLLSLVTAKPETTVAFKSGGRFVTLDSAAIHILSQEVGEHLQACYAKEAAILSIIEAGEVSTFAEIDAFFDGQAA